MGSKPKSKPSFFIVMLHDFTHHLRLPPTFVQKYGEILRENVKLRSDSGETWNVKLERVDEKTYCFSGGWTKFAVDVGLKIGEFIVFWFDIGRSTFDVAVLGYSGCERQISGRGSPIDVSDSDEDVQLIESITNNFRDVKNNQSSAYIVEKEDESDDTQENDYTSEEDEEEEEEAANPQLKLCLQEHHKSRVPVSKNFAVPAGLTGKKTVTLRFPPNQRCWPVKLIHYQNYPQFTFHMGRGWGEFRIKNGLDFGKTYLLEYIRDQKVIEVSCCSTEQTTPLQ